MTTPREIIGNASSKIDGFPVSDVGRADEIIKALKEAGFAIVPVEPTEAMLDAYTKSIFLSKKTGRVPKADRPAMHIEKAKQRYRAMIKAAEKPNE